MPKKFADILHAFMTNWFVILAVAIALFLLVIFLKEHHTQAVVGELWI
jgi:hypothetical protein